jgi:hypothetical protein
MKLTWRKEANECGLAAVGQSPRGLVGRIDGEIVFHVAPSGGSWRGPLLGWYWYGMGKNTFSELPLFKTKEEARDNAKEFYKSLSKE